MFPFCVSSFYGKGTVGIITVCAEGLGRILGTRQLDPIAGTHWHLLLRGAIGTMKRQVSKWKWPSVV